MNTDNIFLLPLLLGKRRPGYRSGLGKSHRRSQQEDEQ
jgi:hypothetical protein